MRLRTDNEELRIEAAEHGMFTRAYHANVDRCIESERKMRLYKKGYEECLNILNPEQAHIIQKTINEVNDGT